MKSWSAVIIAVGGAELISGGRNRVYVDAVPRGDDMEIVIATI